MFFNVIGHAQKWISRSKIIARSECVNLQQVPVPPGLWMRKNTISVSYCTFDYSTIIHIILNRLTDTHQAGRHWKKKSQSTYKLKCNPLIRLMFTDYWWLVVVFKWLSIILHDFLEYLFIALLQEEECLQGNISCSNLRFCGLLNSINLSAVLHICKTLQTEKQTN